MMLMKQKHSMLDAQEAKAFVLRDSDSYVVTEGMATEKDVAGGPWRTTEEAAAQLSVALVVQQRRRLV